MRDLPQGQPPFAVSHPLSGQGGFRDKARWSQEICQQLKCSCSTMFISLCVMFALTLSRKRLCFISCVALRQITSGTAAWFSQIPLHVLLQPGVLESPPVSASQNINDQTWQGYKNLNFGEIFGATYFLRIINDIIDVLKIKQANSYQQKLFKYIIIILGRLRQQ